MREEGTELQKKYLTRCDEKNQDFQVSQFTFVIFGGAGDLSLRKIIPALYTLWSSEILLPPFSILGLGRRDIPRETYQARVKEALKTFASESFDASRADDFAESLHYLSMDVHDRDAYPILRKKIQLLDDSVQDPLFYLSVPPEVLPVIVENMHDTGFVKNYPRSKIIVEKPFGTNRESSIKLNKLLLKAFKEKQIYRIDHYLGKETVQNILFFRFGNSIFEPLWNRRYVDHVQIMVAESIGIEGRGNFYEQSGIVRDIVQNHLLQLLALVAMEPPVGFEADLIRNEKLKVYQTIRPMDDSYIKQNIIRGQYAAGTVHGKPVIAYRKENGVAADSMTSTYFAGRFMLDNWRWANVPFYLRTAKNMPRRLSEIYIQFKQPPLRLFGRTCDQIEPNGLIFSIQPDEEISIRLSVKRPGMANLPDTRQMTFDYEESFELKQHTAYERLLLDSLRGDLTLFARHDEIEAMWGVVDPIIQYYETHQPEDFPNYKAGSWGPDSSEKLIKRDGRAWRFSEEHPKR